MSQVGIKESRIQEIFRGIGMFFSALSQSENIVEDPEEVIKKSGIKDLINRNEHIKNMELMFEEHGTSIKKVRENLKAEDRNKAPKIEKSIVKENVQEIEQDDLER